MERTLPALRWREHSYLWPAGILAATVLLLLPGMVLGPAQDGAIFSVIGEQFTRGDLPYRDAWDHKPPLIYLVTALAAVLPGPTWPWVWAATAAAITATSLSVQRLAGWPAAALAAVSLSMYPVAAGGGQSEQFAAAAAAMAIVVRRPVAMGALAAAAMLFSVQAMPLGLGLLVLGGRQLPRIILGGIGLVVATVAVMGAIGILPAAIDILLGYNGLYVGSAAGLDEAWSMIAGLLALLALAVAYVRPPFSRLDWAMLAWTAGALVLLLVQGRHIGHYVAPTVVPLAVLVGPRLTHAKPVVVTAAVVVGLLLAATISFAQLQGHRGPPTLTVGRWVQEHTSAGDRILDWGVDANVYLVSERAPAGRYPYLMPLVTPGYTTPAMIGEWVAELEASPPAVVVDSEAANPYWSEDEDFLRPPPPGSAGGRNLDLLDPFRGFVRDRYQLATELDGRKVYALR